MLHGFFLPSIILVYDLFDSPDFAALQADFYSVWMGLGFCQDILYDTFRQFTGKLIFFQNNANKHAGFYACTLSTVHFVPVSSRNALKSRLPGE